MMSLERFADIRGRMRMKLATANGSTDSQRFCPLSGTGAVVGATNESAEFRPGHVTNRDSRFFGRCARFASVDHAQSVMPIGTSIRSFIEWIFAGQHPCDTHTFDEAIGGSGNRGCFGDGGG